MRKHICPDAHSLRAALSSIAALALAFTVLLLTPQVAEAKIKIPIPIPWGTSQKMHKLQSIKAPNVKDAYFGYATKKIHVLWILGLYIENQGYAVGSGEESDNQGELINQSDFNRLQVLGLIPKNLPSEPSLTFFDILEGFSLWWIVGLGICLRLIFGKKT